MEVKIRQAYVLREVGLKLGDSVELHLSRTTLSASGYKQTRQQGATSSAAEVSGRVLALACLMMRNVAARIQRCVYTQAMRCSSCMHARLTRYLKVVSKHLAQLEQLGQALPTRTLRPCEAIHASTKQTLSRSGDVSMASFRLVLRKSLCTSSS